MATGRHKWREVLKRAFARFSEPKASDCKELEEQLFNDTLSPSSAGCVEPAEKSLEEQWAEIDDDGELGEYARDERMVHIFVGLRFAPKCGEWVARFRNLKSGDYCDWTYPELIQALRISEVLNDEKPSQTKKAVAAFDAHIDRETAKLNFD